MDDFLVWEQVFEDGESISGVRLALRISLMAIFVTRLPDRLDGRTSSPTKFRQAVECRQRGLDPVLRVEKQHLTSSLRLRRAQLLN